MLGPRDDSLLCSLSSAGPSVKENSGAGDSPMETTKVTKVTKVTEPPIVLVHARSTPGLGFELQQGKGERGRVCNLLHLLLTALLFFLSPIFGHLPTIDLCCEAIILRSAVVGC
jgi:hypothetical protein